MNDAQRSLKQFFWTMIFKLKVHNICEYGQKKDLNGNPHQEDCMFPEFGNQDDPDRLFILCDGAGDNYDGCIASGTVCRVMGQVILNNSHDENNSFTVNDFNKALDEVFDTFDNNDKFNTEISTTLAFLKFHKEGVFIAHIGNSRVYHIRPGISKEDTEIVFETRDHTYANDLMHIGEISSIEAKYHPKRNVVTRSIHSGSTKLKADIYQTKDIKPGDFFFMCTDGMLEQPDMEDGTSLRIIFSESGGNDDNKVRILRSITEMNRDNHSAFLIHVIDVDISDEDIPEIKTDKYDMKMQTLPIGTILYSGTNSYTIKKVLGCGAFGFTYLATGIIEIGNINFDGDFAIKEHFTQSCFRDKDGTRVVYTPSKKNDVELSRKDFLTEARRLHQLCTMSKYIVQVNETFEANGTAYYVMEYLSGGTITACSKSQVIEYMLKLSEAVKVLHDHKVLHMDIKPSNVMLKEDDDTNELYPVLIDFGIAKYFDSKGRPEPKVNGASDGYAPIEQYGDIKSFAPTIDIYALGATCYFLLTGKTPPSAWRLMDDTSILRVELKNINCEEFIPLISKSMSPDYKDRHRDIRAFIEDLNSIVVTDKEINRDFFSDETSSTTIIVKDFPNDKEREIDYHGQQSSASNNQGKTLAVYERICTFDTPMVHISNPDMEDCLRSIFLARDTVTRLFGIIDNQDNVIIPFEYTSIGKFSEIPVGRGANFSYGWRLVAPALKYEFDEQSCLEGLRITSYGKIIKTYYDGDTQPVFHDETSTLLIVKQQSFKVNNKIIRISIQQIPWGQYGITDSKYNVIAPFIYDSIEPFSEYCMLPGPGIPSRFLGAKYTIDGKIGFFRITDNGILIDYVRYDLETYERLRSLS